MHPFLQRIVYSQDAISSANLNFFESLKDLAYLLTGILESRTIQFRTDIMLIINKPLPKELVEPSDHEEKVWGVPCVDDFETTAKQGISIQCLQKEAVSVYI